MPLEAATGNWERHRHCLLAAHAPLESEASGTRILCRKLAGRKETSQVAICHSIEFYSILVWYIVSYVLYSILLDGVLFFSTRHSYTTSDYMYVHVHIYIYGFPSYCIVLYHGLVYFCSILYYIVV